MTARTWILGAPDPEMQAIESLLRECGETVAYAVVGVDRVHPGNAYRAERAHFPGAWEDDARTQEGMGHEAYPADGIAEYWVECELRADRRRAGYRIDHHRPGDPGFGRPPAEFFAASSLGQVCAVLGLAIIYGHRDDACRVLSDHEGPSGWDIAWSGVGASGSVTVLPGANRWPFGKHGLWEGLPYDGDFALDARDALMVAAADHCLGAAYRGECPGVDPDALMAFRTAARAVVQGRSIDAVLADIRGTQAALRSAPLVRLSRSRGVLGECDLGHGLCAHCGDCCCQCVSAHDMRRELPWPELPEAATRIGVGYISGPLETADGREKIVCSGVEEQVKAFLEDWAPRNGLVDCYGDPARGFAGGYLS